MRIAALLIGLLGVIIAFVINLLYSSLHVLGRVTGITNDQSHFFWGLLVILIGFVGSLFALLMVNALKSAGFALNPEQLPSILSSTPHWSPERPLQERIIVYDSCKFGQSDAVHRAFSLHQSTWENGRDRFERSARLGISLVIG